MNGTMTLIYSGDRENSGERLAWSWPMTPAGQRAAWDIVLAAEFDADHEREPYHGYRDGPEMDLDTFNLFWAEYGWLLYEQDDCLAFPQDVMVVHTPAYPTTPASVHNSGE